MVVLFHKYMQFIAGQLHDFITMIGVRKIARLKVSKTNTNMLCGDAYKSLTSLYFEQQLMKPRVYLVKRCSVYIHILFMHEH